MRDRERERGRLGEGERESERGDTHGRPEAADGLTAVVVWWSGHSAFTPRTLLGAGGWFDWLLRGHGAVLCVRAVHVFIMLPSMC